MKISIPLTLAVASLSVACGSSSQGLGNQAVTGGPDSGALGSGSGADAGSGNNPCGLHSGYPGDELCILPPSPDEGIQIHVGPTSYDDPAAVAPYVLAPGDENVKCFNAPISQSGFHYLKQQNRMRTGSHHMLIFAENDPTLQAGPVGACDISTGLGLVSIPGSQTPKNDFPEGELAPEDQGLGRYLPQSNMATFQLHYVNTGSEPVLREAWVNLYKKPDSEVTQPLQSIFMVGDLAANIPPNTEQTTTLEFTPTLPGPIRIYNVSAHMHAHAQTFTLWRGSSAGEQQIYQSFNWEDPTPLTFNSTIQNPAPDAVAHKDGGISGDLTLQPGDSLKWSCDVNNTTNAALHFANEALTAEMCMLVGSYVSTTGGLLAGACANGSCIQGLGGKAPTGN